MAAGLPRRLLGEDGILQPARWVAVRRTVTYRRAASINWRYESVRMPLRGAPRP